MKDKEDVMSIETVLHAMQEKFGDEVLAYQQKSRRLYIDIAAKVIKDASLLMINEFEARFQIATGVDTEAGFEVMYHWALDDDDFVVTIRVVLEHAAPQVDSIALVCPAAEWIEREMWELLGIEFTGHPDMRHLLLADEWPEGKYPMRRDYEATP